MTTLPPLNGFKTIPPLRLKKTHKTSEFGIKLNTIKAGSFKLLPPNFKLLNGVLGYNVMVELFWHNQFDPRENCQGN